MRVIDRIPGFSEAQANGALLRLGYTAEDFATVISLGWFYADSIRTIAAVLIEDNKRNMKVSRAWLTDNLENALPLAEVCELSPDGAAETGLPEHTTILIFGPTDPEAKKLRLEISRIEEQPTGDIFPCIIDPFTRITEEQALHVMAWEEPDNPMTLVPFDTIAGCWAFEFQAPKNNLAFELKKTIDVNKEVPFGPLVWNIEKLEKGLSGWRLTSTFANPKPVMKPDKDGNIPEPPPPRQLPEKKRPENTRWQLGSPEAQIQYLAEEELLTNTDPPLVSLAMNDGTENRPEEVMYGPMGAKVNTFRHFFPADIEAPASISALRVRQFCLPEPWNYEFAPKLMDTPPTNISEKMPPFDFDVKMKLNGIYWGGDVMLVQPSLEANPEKGLTLTAADCAIWDMEGNAHPCGGQDYIETDEGSYYGMQFPPLHILTKYCCFQLFSTDIDLNQPIKLADL